MQLDIHKEIKDKLNFFKSTHKIPNIIFHGPPGSGKRTIVNEFINDLYDHDKKLIKTLVMFVNCAHGKGIKFIREDLKFFAKTNINSRGGDIFKSVILSNADKLTVDAQSALRRCIEVFSHNTRFFIIVEDKCFLLKPILSRFCDIYVPDPIINNKISNLYHYKKKLIFNKSNLEKKKKDWVKKTIMSNDKNTNLIKIIETSNKIYEKGYSALDLIEIIEDPKFEVANIDMTKKYELLLTFNKIKNEIRNEKIIIAFILNFLFLSSDESLENISFM